jgi:PST family polysaccharide transporter
LGVFWAVSEVVGFLGYFSDVGLAAAVIQKKTKPKLNELRATFTAQQVLVICSVLIAFLLTPVLEKKFDFENGHFLYWMLLFGFFTSSLKTIPSVLLERKLLFGKIAIVDLVVQTIFSGLAVFLAWKGFSVNSWAWAIFFRSIVGVILIYIFCPWKIGINFHFKDIKGLFNFGVPFQVNSLLAMLKDRLMNLFLWGILGSQGVGILGWAQRWAQMPLRFLMDQVIRVTFPAYSKLQDQKDHLRRALERSVSLICLLIFPVLAGMGFLMPKVVAVFPKYSKWTVALIPFWLYLGSFFWGVVTTPLVNAFNSVGKVKITLKLMVLWTGLTWIITPLLAKLVGVNGAALGLFLVSSTSFIAWIMAKREFGISFKKILLVPISATAIMVAVLFAADLIFTSSVLEIVGLTIMGGFSYAVVVYMFARDDVDWFFKELLVWKKSIRK